MPAKLEKLMPIQSSRPQARSQARGTGRGAGRAESAEQRRERIARMVWPLFLKKGYDNVSIDEIIGAIGGSKATIYAWFGGKEGLFEAIVRQKCADVVLSIHADPNASVEQQLAQMGHSFLSIVLSPPILEFHRLMVSIGRTFPETGRLFFESGPAKAYSIVGDWIARQQQGGAIGDGDPYRLAVLFLDMLIGERQLGRLTGMPRAARREQIEETVQLAVKVFLRGCAPAVASRPI
jgi:TetR/AcrR family transcriptional regulator, mexJK operon transcriptional repressor